MTALEWDKTGERLYETGVDRGVLYIPNGAGSYTSGFAWNGLTGVTESPEGAESNKQYADNMVYLNLISVEELSGTIEAFTYPAAFGQCDGSAEPEAGLFIGQQRRSSFGLSYRTRLGNDLLADDYGYKLHLIWGAMASPSEKAYATVNDSPEAMTLSWEFSTTPVPVPGHRPTSIVTIDSTKADPASLAALETVLYGTVGVDPRLPFPAELITMFGGSITNAIPEAPTFNAVDNVITIPSVTGLEYYNSETGVVLATGAMDALADGESILIAVRALGGYAIPAGYDTDWYFIGGTI